MDCTKEQYEKYLKEELLKMGYKEHSINYWDDSRFHHICNNYNGHLGGLGTIREYSIENYNRTYLGSFNAPLFLALAAMTDKAGGGYREYYVKDNEFYYMNERGFLGANGLFCKATKEEIMEKFGGKDIAIKDDSSLNTQIGGNHYKEMPIQPIEFITKNNIPYIEGNIIKYICRHRNKNKAEDIKKVIHYCKLILELEYNEK